ncbi:MAG: phosphatase PAP2 family protein [Gammaproteobacteria bacterium]|nr:phosphatase PAP2 family protein [Gammaproteobacteria bacterium]
MDQQLLLAVNQGWGSSGLDVFFAWISQSKAFSIPLLLGVLVFFGWRFGQAGIKFWLVAIVLVGVGDQLGALLKYLMAQPRPCAELGDAVRRVDTLFHINCSHRLNGWPSNHALNFFLFATFSSYVLHWRGWAVGFVMLAVLVSLSRVYLGVHYPSQVVSGALIGIALGLAEGWLVLRYLPVAKTVQVEARSGMRGR